MNYRGQFQDDAVIEKYFLPSFVGTAIDVGATDGSLFSNTLLFEERGWRVLCIEANPLYEKPLRACRKEVQMCAVANYHQNDVKFHVIDLGNNMTACSALQVDERLKHDHQHLIKHEFDMKVNVRTLDYCISEAGLESLDLLCVDVEGGEIDVLKGFDIDCWKPKLIVLEINYTDDRQCEEYLKQFDYHLDKRHYVNEFYTRDA